MASSLKLSAIKVRKKSKLNSAKVIMLNEH